jgi:cobalt-zinc-cadmium efflux system membrane fusion protein
MNIPRFPLARVLTLALAGLAATNASAQQAMACLILPEQVVEVGSPVVGVLEHLDVDRGSMVKKGQVVARLGSDVERANVQLAQQRLAADGDLQGAVTNHEYLKRRSERTESLLQQNFISPQALDQARTEENVAERRVRSSKEARLVAKRELDLAEAQLSQRTIRSPLTGVVVERYMVAGERVEEKAILKIAAVDPLRVEVLVPSVHFMKVKAGMMAKVMPDLPGLAPVQATVQSVDRVVDPTSNTFRVRLSLPNPDNAIPAGLRCKVSLGVEAVDPSKPLNLAPSSALSRLPALKM